MSIDELLLMAFLVRQELQVEIAYLPGILKFDDAIIYPN
jgi:hypothetical protein